jgi:hypothetical protein
MNSKHYHIFTNLLFKERELLLFKKLTLTGCLQIIANIGELSNCGKGTYSTLKNRGIVKLSINRRLK